MTAPAFLPAAELTALRQKLHANGYLPVPVSDPTAKAAGRGKAPLIKNWRQVAETADPDAIATWPTAMKGHGNTGLLTGALVGLDLDVPDAGLALQVEALADVMLPATPLHRIGSAPKSLRCFRAATPLPKLETAELFFPDGSKAQVEALGTGQQFVAHGIHPGTGQPYAWPKARPEAVPLAELPEVTEATLRGFLAAAEGLLRAVGGRTAAERAKADAPAPAPAPTPAPQPAATAATPSRSKRGGTTAEFFKAVNRAALGNIGRWLPAIFPRAKQEAGTGAWRVKSADMGRGLEEDLSIHPQNGGQDFGTRASCSPIDVVMEHGGAASAQDAALWLCEHLGIEPASFGWKGGGKAGKPAGERPERDEPDSDGKPLIRVVGGKVDDAVDLGEEAMMAARLPVYQRGNVLVRPWAQEGPASHNRTTMIAGLAGLNAFALVDLMCQAARWERFDGRVKDWVRIDPPYRVGSTLLARVGAWRVPTIAGVITTPTMRADGSIVEAPGYDPATKLFHAVDPALKLHPAVRNPTRKDAEKAIQLLHELLDGFPLVGPVARAVALSALITPVVRGAIPVAPMHLFRAPSPGSGKSYAVDLASAIASGRLCPVITASPDPAETEKRIVGLLMAGCPLVSLDNVNGELGSDLLCQMVERELLQVRALGSSALQEITSRSTVFGTGNNARVRGDMVRRTLVIDLDAQMERPELREFPSDPVALVLGDRGRYVSAALIVVRAYILAGQPDRCPGLASFQGWSDLVRSPLVWLGCADPAMSMEKAREEDPELGELREVMGPWREAFGNEAATARVLVDKATTPVPQADENGDPPPYGARTALPFPALKDALLRVAGIRGAIDAQKLGYWLRSRRDRPLNGLCIRRSSDTRDGVATWRVERVG